MNAIPPTPVQGRILEFMREFLAREDRMPSLREIAAHFGCCQTNTAQHINRMTTRGFLEYRTVKGKPNGWWRFPRKDAQPEREALAR